MEEFYHLPVMPEECLEGLDIDPAGIYVDATLGGGGHSELIAKRLTSGRLICLDRDEEAIAAGKKRLSPYPNVAFVKTDFRELKHALERVGIGGIDGALFDLGTSSHQLDVPARGFSYMKDAPLDMRMDREQSYSAYDFVNGEDEAEIKRVLYEYGEERYAARIASAIVAERAKKPIETTFALSEIIKSAMPAAARREKQHPAKRSFQAIRIAVNSELDALREGLSGAFETLKPGGRLCVITFHSLEDRIVKEFFAQKAKGCICLPDFPVCVCGRKPELRLIRRKPVTAGADELERNPRSRSANLRVAERLGPEA